jgi:hypothetical protein
MFSKLGKDCRPAKPTIHENVVCLDTKGQNPLYHILKVFGGLGRCLQTPSIAAGPFIQRLLDVLYSLFCLSRRAKNKIQGQEAEAIGPSQCQQLETFQACSTIMIKNPGQKFNNLGAGSIIGAIIKDQDLLSRIIGEPRKEVGHLDSQGQHKLSPVVARILQQIIGCILLEWQMGIGDYSSVKIIAFKGQHENSGENRQGRYSSQFPDTILIEKCADPKISNERKNSTLQSFCFLLLLMLSGNIHYRPSFLILLMFVAKTNIP